MLFTMFFFYSNVFPSISRSQNFLQVIKNSLFFLKWNCFCKCKLKYFLWKKILKMKSESQKDWINLSFNVQWTSNLENNANYVKITDKSLTSLFDFFYFATFFKIRKFKHTPSLPSSKEPFAYQFQLPISFHSLFNFNWDNS